MSLDWQKIALNLRSAGVSSKFLMSKTGISDKTFSNWRRGTVQEPRFSRGLELLKLHAQFCPKEHREEIYENC